MAITPDHYSFMQYERYTRKDSCRQSNTKHTFTSDAKDTRTYTTTQNASTKHILVKIHERHK